MAARSDNGNLGQAAMGTTSAERTGWQHAVTTRVVAGGLGTFVLVNLLAAAGGGLDGNGWWVSLRPLPAFASGGLLLAAGLLLFAGAISPRMRRRRRRLTALVLALLLAFVVRDAIVVASLFASGRPSSPIPVPLSAVTAAVLVLLVVGLWRRGAPQRGRLARIAIGVAAAGLLVAGFPLAQMTAFGKTDYRRPADAVVIFGAGVKADGTPSDALADRVRTGAELYHQGLVEHVILSGGPGGHGHHETDAMWRLAAELGVPEDVMLVDRKGLSTGATVANTARIFEREGICRVLCVSHAYHLPRVKMAYQARGLDVFTVPARETKRLVRMPWYMARETAAFWFYWGRSAARFLAEGAPST